MFKNAVSNSLFKVLTPHFSLQNVLGTRNYWKEKDWLKHNDKVYEPQGPDEEPRPAFVCHTRQNIKYSYKKLWYIACFVRGMTVDEALKQLQFINKKGAVAVRDTILEAQQMAVLDHNVEFKTNLWVSESFVEKGVCIKGIKRKARGNLNIIRHRYTHYYVTLEEGKPPKDYYYHDRKKSGEELLTEWLDKMRSRNIIGSL